MAYTKSKEHTERMQRIDKEWADLEKRIEQSRAEMNFMLKHRFKIWAAMIVFWILVFKFIL